MTWQDDLPNDVQSWEEVKNSDSPEKFWTQIQNMKSLIGQSIRIPSKEAGEADWGNFHDKLQAQVPGLIPTPKHDDVKSLEAFYTALGKPAEASKYSPPKVDLKGVKVSELDGLKTKAHELNLTQAQFEGLAKEFTELEVQSSLSLVEAQQNDLNGLKSEWGLAFDDRTKKIANFIELTNAPEALKEAAKSGKLDAESMKWMQGIVEKFGGAEGLNLIDDRSKAGVLTPDEARHTISEIMHNREHAYWVARDPGHADALQNMVRLQKLANPGASTDINDLRAGGVSGDLARTMQVR